ncbi:hypothetical protein GCM10023080_019440 [Streptomyces pseudoechinosporeus]
MVLTAFTVGVLALTAVAARRKQVWTLDRLHPELSVSGTLWVPGGFRLFGRGVAVCGCHQVVQTSG